MLGQSSVYVVPGVHAAREGERLGEGGDLTEASSKWLGSDGLGGRAIDKLSAEVHVKSLAV